MKKYKWSQQEEEFLKMLRQQKKMKSWKEISLQLTKRFPDSSKSSKQCRQKYINYSRFVGNNKTELNQTWSLEDDRVLAKLYNQSGSSWSSFTLHLLDKYEQMYDRSENSIKNRFYNRLKKFAKKLDDHRSTHSQQVRVKSSSYQSMIRILDFTNQIKNLCQNTKMDFNQDTNMFTARVDILHLCFDFADQSDIPCEQYCKLSKKMKEINVKIRCFGICKAKNRKNWKLTERGFLSSMGFDNKTLADIKNQQAIKIHLQTLQNASKIRQKQKIVIENQHENEKKPEEVNQDEEVEEYGDGEVEAGVGEEHFRRMRQEYEPYLYMNPYMYMNPYAFFMVPPPYLLPPNQVKVEQPQLYRQVPLVKQEQIIKKQVE